MTTTITPRAARPVHSRRALLGALLGIPLASLASAISGSRAFAAPPLGKARRVIFFYFPDGVPMPGGTSLWHAAGSETSFTLPEATAPLAAHKDACVFLSGLSMGGTDSGSHPGGAKKLLTGVDGGNGESIDRYLSRTVGGDAPFRHVYLGAMATQNNASGDKYVSYPAAGTTAAPEDSPRRAFERLFGAGAAPVGTGSGSSADPADVTVIDSVLADLNELRGRLGDTERSKLDLHLESVRDLERRVKSPGSAVGTGASCTSPSVDTRGVDEAALNDAARFPAVLRAQIDTLVLAMACGLTRIGVVQASQHTSELIMSRFPATEMERPGFDMRSHQASHYGQRSDAKLTDYVQQRRWFASQFAYLIDALAKRPEGDGTMLDHTLAVLCSEVADGNDHLHDNMPFVLAGKAGGALRTGRHLQFGYRRHSDLLVGIARAMGDSISTFGQECTGPLPGLLT